MNEPVPANEAVRAIKELIKEWDRYHMALGRFIEMFALVELSMQLTLWHYAKVPPRTARAIFSGVKTEAAMGHINRLVEPPRANKAIRDDLEYVFKQLAAINKLRNDLVHFVSHTTREGARVISNSIMARSRRQIRRAVISPETFIALEHDLMKIQSHLLVRHFGRRLVRQNERPRYQRDIDAAWRYIPPPQAPHPKRKRRGKTQGRRSQRASSPT
ncbi:hypothetical protein FRZ44_39200 [Hypericibacter terrae]|uniref:Uncharacterized protein n=1 Tax=Hypericibacter terrae TaxID=2602015 RepID=A0A5J6MML0_9PROT|nr:hypothetical protein [Hypericibacter terrae]QEX18613.1 hypothetical protein FRZ44_39200 [Hypericibacter terrae]